MTSPVRQTLDAEIQDLIDDPREQLHVELKSWLDMTDDVTRAKLAKHFAALANFGGGYLLIGFGNSGVPSSGGPPDLSIYDQDAITGIVDKYLSPAFQCEVFEGSQTGGSGLYPIVRVPSHKSVPIFSKKNGPSDARGQPQGIVAGRCYIRVPGPKSIAIETPEQWRELIHRCVINERDALLQSIGRLIREPVQQPKQFQLMDWHRKMHSAYLTEARAANWAWPVSIRDNHYQFSYSINVTGAQTTLGPSELREAVRRAGEAVRQVINTGWSMFHQFSGSPLAPRIVLDDASGEQIDALEANLLPTDRINTGFPDYWRITVDGRGTIIRPYREDRNRQDRQVGRNLGPGNWLSPNESLREVYELVMHAKEMTKAFSGAETVDFCCSWYGLKDRQIAEFNDDGFSPTRICHENSRTTKGSFAIERLTADTASLVVELVSPMLRLFDGLEISRDWVEYIRPRWKMF